MTRLLPAHSVSRGGLAARLFALFLLASLLPLALSDWVSGSAVAEIANELDLASRTQTTRQVGLQVYDHLLTGKTLMAALLSSDREPGAAPHPGRALRALVQLQADAAGPGPGADDLHRTWLAAARDFADRSPAAPRAAPQQLEFELRAVPVAGRSMRVLLGASRGGVLLAIAEFDPDYLWEPLANAADDAGWSVLDSHGRELASQRASDEVSGRTGSAADGLDSRWALFLGGEFQVADWTFVQRSPRRPLLWHGQPLVAWLGLVALATLLSIALFGRWRIRRALVPLAQLTEGTRLFAGGARDTRVAVRSGDEIGLLAHAFNDMAQHIEAQFDLMQALASLDQDILGGMSFAHLAERVLMRLAALYPDAEVVVAWRTDEGRRLDRVCCSPAVEGARSPMRSVLMLDEAQDQAVSALCLDECRDLRHPAWHDDRLLPLCQGAVAAAAAVPWMLLPLRLNGRTVALLALGLAEMPSHTQLEPARELRDRLVVAFAARSRDDQLMHRAVHDSLTGLANRAGLNQHIDQRLTVKATRLALLFIDLDHFKDVNDTRGHEVGDELLCLASRRLEQCVGGRGFVARQGGDEYAVVIAGACDADVFVIAADTVVALARPFVLHDSECVLGASVGIAFHPEHGRSREELLRCADVALYAAKAAGRGRYVAFDATLDAAVNERARLVEDLRAAIQRAEFVVHFQPRVRASDGAIASAEALVRWQHPTRGLLAPNSFIGVAESSGLIDGVGRWVLDAACAQMAAWRRDRIGIERVSVNVSPLQLASGELPSQVSAALARHDLPASCLEIEVTESLLVDDTAGVRVQLEQLRSWGVSIALDDFGTGYSSMSSLRQLPIDVMKIDRSFVKDLGSDDGAMAVIRAIVALAQAMHVHLVAEGVETPEQASLLRDMGCGEFQGFLYSRPVAPEEFTMLPGLRGGGPSAVHTP